MDEVTNSYTRNIEQSAKAFAPGLLNLLNNSLGGGIILKTKSVTPIECLHYAMTLPTSVVITGCDSKQTLQQALEAARTFKPLSEKERLALLEKTAPQAMAGQFELYKSTEHFDGTTRYPEWMG